MVSASGLLDLVPPHRAVVLSLFPGDPIVGSFCEEFERTASPGVIAKKINSKSWEDLCDAARDVGSSKDHNCLVLVTHGGPDHVIDMQDPQLAEAPKQIQDSFQHLGPISALFSDLFDDKMVFLALCYGGDEGNVLPLQRTAMALHVVAAHRRQPKLHPVAGAKAMASFMNTLAEHENQSLPPNVVGELFELSQESHSGVLDFWPYRGSSPTPRGP